MTRGAHLLPHDGPSHRGVLYDPVHNALRTPLGFQFTVREGSRRFDCHSFQRRRIHELIHETHLQSLVRPNVLALAVRGRGVGAKQGGAG